MPVMLVATWNVNSIKQRLDNLVAWLTARQPDIVCLQETKCDEVTPRLDGDHAADHARFIEAVVSTKSGVLRIASIYLPNGNPANTDKYDYKMRWMERLHHYAQRRLTLDEPLVLAGDYNVIPDDADVYDPAAWIGDALFKPETRAKFRALANLGLTDAVRSTSDAAGLYSFWDYQAGAWQRNKGLRIDHLLLSPQAADRLVWAGIDKHVRGWERPSDHVPVVVELDLEAS